MIPLYGYRAVVDRVIDGDTVRLDIDLGFKLWLLNSSFRLNGCNARELHDAGGPEARDNLATLLPAGGKVTIRSVKADKYGDRYDAEVLLGDGRALVAVLAADGWIAPWDGHGPRPVPPWPRAAGPTPAAARRRADPAGRAGYDQAIATLTDVALRTGSTAAQWAADYLTMDPDGLAPADR